VVLLNGKNRVIRTVTVSEGSLTSCLVHPREVFVPAVRESSASILLVHNHPSGDPSPSREDIEINRRLIEAGEVMGISVLDHVVMGDGRYFSFVDEGLMESGRSHPGGNG
jgi:DNA repair protein RadC